MFTKFNFHHPVLNLFSAQGRRLLPGAWLISIGILLGAAQVCITSEKSSLNEVAGQVKQEFIGDLGTFKEQCRLLTQQLELVNQQQVTPGQAQAAFVRAKAAYKKVEYLLEYLDPELGRHLNGPPIPKVVIEHQDYLTLGFKEPAHVTFPPEGLQVLEELLFTEAVEKANLKKALVLSYRLQEKTALFLGNLQAQHLTDKQIMGSLREHLVRVMTLGVTGFDAPAAGNEIQHMALSLDPVLQAAQLYETKIAGAANEPAQRAVTRLKKAAEYLHQNPDFETFDRLFFIRELADPVYAALTDLEFSYANLTETRSNALIKPVHDRAKSVFSPDFLQPNYYAKEDRTNPGTSLITLGKALFFDPVLSANNQRACASCHVPAKAFTDGRTKSISFNDQGTVNRNSPTLLNAVFSKAYFWDSRADFIQDQVPGVLTKPEELHGTYEEVVQKLNLSKDYRRLFKRAFKDLPAGNTINTNTINRALAAYIQTLVGLNSPFDRYMRHETDILPEAAKRGFNLFMGKAACGTCHFPPVFNGTVPPRYLESESEVLGVPATADLNHPVLDQDPGRGGIITAEALKHSFKTPTVRNVALTGPYMHNGVFPTLADVLEFYNRGGGAGLRLAVPNQTLPATPLELTEEEKNDIISFMETLTDTTALTSVPKALPQFPADTGLNKRPLGGRY